MSAIIITAVWGVVMMLCGAFIKDLRKPKYIAMVGVLLAIGCTAYELKNGVGLFGMDTIHINVNNMLDTTTRSLLFILVVLGCTLLYFLLNGRDIEHVGNSVSEYFALIFFILCGIAITSTFNSLLMLFLGIEIISIPLYILTGSDKRNLKSNEAALKYFLMGAFSTGLMLLGIAFIYGGSEMGTFYMNQLMLGSGKLPPMIAIGLVLLMISMSFKVSAAPFHFWTPDVYDGAPTVFTSFMATIVKVAAFYAFVRLFENAFGNVQAQWQTLIAIITAATLIIGNLTAVFQQSVKRMLAYSSIAQAGFMLFAVYALNNPAKEGLVLYAAAYSVASIGIFALLVRMKDYTIDGFNGLGKTQPLLALTTTIFLLSLTGIPLTAGFQAKFYMILAAVQNTAQMNHNLWLVIVAMICAAISAYYYFRIIQAIYFKEPAEGAEHITEANTGYKVLMVVAALITIALGVLPFVLTDWLYYNP